MEADEINGKTYIKHTLQKQSMMQKDARKSVVAGDWARVVVLIGEDDAVAVHRDAIQPCAHDTDLEMHLCHHSHGEPDLVDEPVGGEV